LRFNTIEKFSEEVYFGKSNQKPLAIITNDFSNTFYNSNKVYKDLKYKKLILSSSSNISRFLEYQQKQYSLTSIDELK
jgi:hypothetical protein